MRRKLFDVLTSRSQHSRWGRLYNALMLAVVIVSILPLAFRQELAVFRYTDAVVVCVFVLDYLLRWATADYQFGRPGVWSFVRYPFSLMALVDLLSILPSVTMLNEGFRLVRLSRGWRLIRVMTLFRTIHHSRNIWLVFRTIQDTRDSLLAVCVLAISYIVLSALVIFQVEPESFRSFFDAVYWATVSLTTVGYGDIYPVSAAGRVVAMVSSFCGIALIALPAGIITAGYMEAMRRTK